MAHCDYNNQRRWAAGLRLATAVVLGLQLLLARWPGQLAQAQAPGGPREFSDEQVKAALVLHFFNKTEWPAGSGPGLKGSTTIGVVGAPAFARALRALVSDGAEPGPAVKPGINVVELNEGDNPSECQAIYFGQNDKTAREFLEKVGRQPLLTIGEGREFTAAGGIFGFERFQRKIRYWFSLDAMGRSGLRIDSTVTRLQLKPENKRNEE